MERWREHLARELAAYAEFLARAVDEGRVDAPIEHCPGWSVRDLTAHLIELHGWVARAIEAADPSSPQPRQQLAPPPDRELSATFQASADEVLAALDRDPAAPCWTFAPDRTVGFWQRRQPHEHAIHRWDLAHALAADTVTPRIDPELCRDGIDEVIGFFWPRQVLLGRAEPPSHGLRLRATSGEEWLLGDPMAGAEPSHAVAPHTETDTDTDTDSETGNGTGNGTNSPTASATDTAPDIDRATQPVATVTGDLDELLLLLWGRQDPLTLTWSGDRLAGLTVLDRPLTP